MTQEKSKGVRGEKKETWENKLLERGSEERAEEEKTAGGKKNKGGNPLIRTCKQRQLSCESQEQDNSVTNYYCEHGSIQHKHPCVLLRRWVTLKIRCHRLPCFSSSKRRSVKNKQRETERPPPLILFTAQISCPVGKSRS